VAAEIEAILAAAMKLIMKYTGLFIYNVTLSKFYCKNIDNTIKTYCTSLDAETVKVLL
jgi:hypothetical protein